MKLPVHLAVAGALGTEERAQLAGDDGCSQGDEARHDMTKVDTTPETGVLPEGAVIQPAEEGAPPVIVGDATEPQKPSDEKIAAFPRAKVGQYTTPSYDPINPHIKRDLSARLNYERETARERLKWPHKFGLPARGA